MSSLSCTRGVGRGLRYCESADQKAEGAVRFQENKHRMNSEVISALRGGSGNSAQGVSLQPSQ